jgi:hypothetical protein
MKLKHFILLLLVPLSEAKALFYNSDKKVSWYLFSEHKRYLCNVVEDYSNILIMTTIFYYISFVKLDLITKKICLFLFVANILDLIHLGLMDLEYFIALKLLLAYIILIICNKSKIF